MNQAEIVKMVGKLKKSYNIILHGAPGTGKTYLAKQMAAQMIWGNPDFETLAYSSKANANVWKEHVGFVQFHPSYDYTDFVEGLRPVYNATGGSIGFELKDGIFKEFVDRARKASGATAPTKSASAGYSTTTPTKSISSGTSSLQSVVKTYIDGYIRNGVIFSTKSNSTKFKISGYKKKYSNKTPLNIVDLNGSTISTGNNVYLEDIVALLQNHRAGINGASNPVTKIGNILGFTSESATPSYYYAIFKKLDEDLNKYPISTTAVSSNKEEKIEDNKEERTDEYPFIFIIDEINRGEISKILGELFFSIDPGYRGPKGAVSTQYSNLHTDKNYKFYIPENVYIIGTMNDIDRSVDSFDFAMRRRFRFIEIRADDQRDILGNPTVAITTEAIKRMDSLNNEINTKLGGIYEIGPGYFIPFKDGHVDADGLWNDYLEPLLVEYVRGRDDEKDLIDAFEKAYKNY